MGILWGACRGPVEKVWGDYGQPMPQREAYHQQTKKQAMTCRRACRSTAENADVSRD